MRRLDAEHWLKNALPDCAFVQRLAWLEETDSTNDEIRRLAADGGVAPIAVFADSQSKGRGRLGRSFQSAAGKGLYFSLFLKPECSPETMSTMTAWAAVAVCGALNSSCGISPKIKWPNDIVLNGKKLCGILTELLTDTDGTVQGLILGIGLNVSQTAEDFGTELQGKATSLLQNMNGAPERVELAKAMLSELEKMSFAFLQEREVWLERYRKACLTVGRSVVVSSPEGVRTGVAEAVEQDLSLRVRFDDNSTERVFSGEVSVRGLYGYI